MSELNLAQISDLPVLEAIFSLTDCQLSTVNYQLNLSPSIAMTFQTELEQPPSSNNPEEQQPATTNEKILCPHCLRTATNGIKCKGICVSDNDY